MSATWLCGVGTTEVLAWWILVERGSETGSQCSPQPGYDVEESVPQSGDEGRGVTWGMHSS